MARARLQFVERFVGAGFNAVKLNIGKARGFVGEGQLKIVRHERFAIAD
jgi:hypothetical protein